MTMRRLYADENGDARFETWTPQFEPANPAADQLGVSAPLRASACMLIKAPAGGGHPTQPEAGRRLVVMVSGECEVTASGETIIGRPGDVLLFEDTTGTGHSSSTATGFTALMIVLD